MPTELDNKLVQIMDAMTQPGQMFETTQVKSHGAQVPAFVNAPPSIAHYFAHFCAEHADEEFLVDGDIRLTFGECYTAACAVAHGLASRQGISKGDRVGIAARNSANWIISYMGIEMAGGCATLLNGFWTGEELAYGIRLAECSLVLADAARAARLEGTEHPAKVVTIGHEGPPSSGLAPVWAEGDTAANMLAQLGPQDVATILYTSGSTGQPRGAWCDHRSKVHGVMSYVSQSAMALQLLTMQGEAPTSQPCALIAVPLFHVTGEVPLFLQSYAIGRKLVLMPKWDAREALRLIEAEKVSYFVGVPLMSYEMATHPERSQFDLSSCTGFAAGGAPRPVEHVTKIKEAFPDGYPLLGYGLTETNGVGCGNFNENYLAKPGSTGRASRPLVELAILDDDGKSLPQGAVGEVCFRTLANFCGYWRDEDATRAAFTADGFFRTGDLGYIDEDAYLFIVDRKKDIIIRGGENISCLELEEAVYAHDDIAECSTFGVPDERLGEVPAAVYFLKPGRELSADELRGFLAGRIAPFKVPQYIWRADEHLPRLGTQKVDRRTTRKLFASEFLET